jgi:TolB-like protein/DNA-binding winged helix-turn-helix (wHTH) protein
MEHDESSLSRFTLGDIHVDPPAYTLSRNGDQVALEPRAMAVLCYLVEHRDRVVTNEELMSALWDGVIVTPNAVVRVVAQLRKSLGDDARNPRYIRTVVRGGYQVVAPVGDHPAPLSGSFTEPPRLAVWLSAVVGLAAVIVLIWLFRPTPPIDPSVAVLPFANMTGNPELSYLGDGVSEEIINALTQVASLGVSSRTASFKFREAGASLQTIARELGVTHLVEGSVRRSDDSLRITAQLIDVESGFHLWSQTADFSQSDIFQAYAAISLSLREALQEALALPPADIPIVKHVPQSEAYDLYLRGRYIWHRRGSVPLQQAIDLFFEATQVDPDYPDAWAALASAYLTYPNYSSAGYRTWALAEKAAEKALSLDPELAEPYAVLATFRQVEYNWIAAEELLLKALEQNPKSVTANYWYSQHLAKVGRQTLALDFLNRTVSLDPAFLPPQNDYVFAAMYYGQYGWADRQLEAIESLGFSSISNWGARLILSLLTRDFATAQYLISDGLPPRLSQHKEVLGDVMGRYIEAVEQGDIPPLLGQEIVEAPLPNQFKPWLLGRLGDYERLEALANERYEQGRWVEIRSLWGPQTGFPEQQGFLRLARKLNLIEYWEAVSWPDFCGKTGDQVRCKGSLDAADFERAITGARTLVEADR